MEYIILTTATFLVSVITLYSGFGLGTLLLPVFILFLPVHIAVGATAVVHFANNIFKLVLVGGQANKKLVLQFGIPALVSAFIGAWLLGIVSQISMVYSYTLGPIHGELTPIKLLMGSLIFVFSLFELNAQLRKIRFSEKYLVIGGILSGFFGGLSGHQGALRATFLTKTGLSPAQFVGTNACIGFLVDLARLLTYGALYILSRQQLELSSHHWQLIGVGCLAAFCGVLVAKRFLHKVRMTQIQLLTGTLLLLISLLLVTGLI